jgi:hypothetical protein
MVWTSSICSHLDLTAGFVLPLRGVFQVGKVAGRLRASSRTKWRDNCSLKHCRYRYFDKLKWAEKFMDGELMFRSLSYYQQIEDGKVRGDPNEGSVSFQPKSGIIITKENEPSFRIPDGSAFNSGVNTEDIFILCGSNSMSDRLREGFEAVACVEIRKVAIFCDRIKAELSPTATFRAERVVYYSKANEIGAKWEFPDMIAFSKMLTTTIGRTNTAFAFLSLMPCSTAKPPRR